MNRLFLKICQAKPLFSMRRCNYQLHTQPLMKSSQLNSSLKMKMFTINIRTIQLSPQRPINPLLLTILKSVGVKGGKWATVLISRFARKRYMRLPQHMQTVSRHKVATILFISLTSMIGYYTQQHYDIVPIIGRRRWITFTEDQAIDLANKTHNDMKNDFKGKYVADDHPYTVLCHETLQAILKSNQDIEGIKNINWHINVVKDDQTVNAFVLPNGEIYMFSGMINFLKNQNELAVVLGHEMAHALLGHSQEQQTFLMISQLLAIPLLSFIWFIFDDIAASIVHFAQHWIMKIIFAMGFNLPRSRQMESEADLVGLKLISKACMDPRFSVALYERLTLLDELKEWAADDEEIVIAKSLLEYTSTHPSNKKRVSQFEDQMITLLALRESCNCESLDSCEENPLHEAANMRHLSNVIRNQRQLEREIEELKASQIEDENLSKKTKLAIEEKRQELHLLQKMVNKKEVLSKHVSPKQLLS